MAHISSIPEEIKALLSQYQSRLEELPGIINLAFSGERKPEAWHVRVPTKQVVRGFNKAAPVTVMLPLQTWRKLLKKQSSAQWQKEFDDGQIHVHGDTKSAAAFTRVFTSNGVITSVDPT